MGMVSDPALGASFSAMPGPEPLLERVAKGAAPAGERIGYGAAFRVNGEVASASTPLDRALVGRVIRRALAEGAALVDTADSYGPRLSEELIAEFLHPYPPGLLLATKGGVSRGGRGEVAFDGRPERLRAACLASLARLRREAIDLYQLHWPDPAVPFAEQVGALARLREEGLIRHIGLCNVTRAQVEEACALAPIATVQGRLGLAHPEGLALAEACRALGIAFIAFGSLAVLRRPTLVQALEPMAAARGVPVSRLALAWVLAIAPNALVIPGTLNEAHLSSNMRAALLGLGAEEARALASSRPAT